MCIFSQTYCVDSQTRHLVYLQNYPPRDINMWKMKIQNFNSWNVILWTKTQNAAWFQYNNFSRCNFYSLKIFYIHTWRTCFSMLRKYIFVQGTRDYIFVVMKTNEWKVQILLTINLCIRKRNTRTFNATI